MRSLCLLGSTGSIGRQALAVVDDFPELFQVTALSAHLNQELLFEQVRRYRPQMAALTGGACEVPEALRFCQWHFGRDALALLAREAPADDVLVSVSGMVGLRCVIAALEKGRRVLLANKEALVAGGELVMRLCRDAEGSGPRLLPIDSEHSAVYQCLQASNGNPYRRITLTASGGPFLTWDIDAMQHASPEQALRHPNWSMGAKITVDSASMFNKALEIIEARWLFDAAPDQIDVLIHPQSIIHSMVEFEDGAVLAQLGTPDMRIPIAYAMHYPRRLKVDWPALDLARLGMLSFEEPHCRRFPAIPLAYQAIRAGGAAACMLSAANEVAVDAFLKGELHFGGIYALVDATLQRLGQQDAGTLEAVEAADALARLTASQLKAKVRLLEET